MRPAQVAPPTRQGVIGRALRVVVACMIGFVIAAAGTSLIWWALVDEPTPRLASELLDTLAPQAVLEQARVAYPIDTHLGASVIRAEVDRLDLGQLTDRATSAGWSSTRPSDDTVVIDTGDTRLEVTPTSLTVDPHQSPWPALAQLLAGLAGAGAVALTAVVRARTGGDPTPATAPDRCGCRIRVAHSRRPVGHRIHRSRRPRGSARLRLSRFCDNPVLLVVVGAHRGRDRPAGVVCDTSSSRSRTCSVIGLSAVVRGRAADRFEVALGVSNGKTHRIL